MRLPWTQVETTSTSLQLAAVSVILGALTCLTQDYFYIIASSSLIAYLAFSVATFNRQLRLLKTAIVTVETERKRVPIGRPIRISVSLTNPLAVPIRILRIEWNTSSHGTKTMDPQDLQATLQPKTRFTFQRQLKAKTGGQLDIESIALRVSYRGDLFQTLVHYPSETSVEIHPTPLPGKSLTPTALYGGETHPLTQPSGTDYYGSRQYQPGDDLQKIDWKATARLTRLMVKEFDTEANFQVVILLDTSQSMNKTAYVGTRLDEAAAVAFLLTKAAVAQGKPVSLIQYSESNLSTYMAPSAVATQVTQILSLLMGLSRKRTDSQQPEAARPRPLRTIVHEIEELEILRERKESSQFAEKILPMLKMLRTFFFVRLRRQGLFQALTAVSSNESTPSVIVVLTDLETQLDALIEGTRIAERNGHGVIAVQICSPWRIERDLERCYIKYQENQRTLTQLVSNGIAAIDVEPEMTIDALNRETAKAISLRPTVKAS